jgi:alkanesulfonate monooxygenase SsuD/methylene tetrahydromethanopterin reductase-like flavin-dependent oxidoreductase (luciferase family)
VPVSDNRGRFDEALQIIRQAWTQERVTFRGRFYDVEDVAVVPRPVQQPHPPIRVAVHTAESFAHIAHTGLPIYSGTTTTPLPQLRDCMTLYRAGLAAAGHPWRDDQMALMFPIHVGASGATAREAMRPGVRKYYENLQTIFSQLPDSYADHLPRLRIIEATLANLPFDTFVRDQAVFGDAAEVTDRLQAARDEFGLSQIIGWFDQGSMLPPGEAELAMRRFAEHVMRKLA